MYIKFKGDIATCFSFYNLIVDPALGRKSSAGSNICWDNIWAGTNSHATSGIISLFFF